MIAQAIRAILLASATAATLVGRRARSLMIHGRFVPCRSAYRMTASAPTVSIERRYLLPCLVMPVGALAVIRYAERHGTSDHRQRSNRQH